MWGKNKGQERRRENEATRKNPMPVLRLRGVHMWFSLAFVDYITLFLIMLKMPLNSPERKLCRYNASVIDESQGFPVPLLMSSSMTLLSTPVASTLQIT